MKAVYLRALVRSLNATGHANTTIAASCGIGVAALDLLMSGGILPSPASVERLEAFAATTLPATQPKPRPPIADRIRRAGQRRTPLIGYAGRDSGREWAASP